MERVKVAVIGCGMISHVYLRNMTGLFSILEVAAVCDMNRELAEAAAKEYGVPRVMTLDEIAASPDIELAVNLTGPAAHYDVIRRLLLAGKHVYTEKTMTANLEQARELVRLADERKLYLGVAPDTVLGASVQTARWAVEKGLIGLPTSCVASINRNQSLNAERFRFLRAPGGALSFDVGVYYVQSLLTIFGPVRKLTGFAAPATVHRKQFLFREEDAEQWEIPGGNLVTGALRFENGTLGVLHFDGNTIGAERSTFRIYGTEGILELGDPNCFGDPVTLYKPENPACTLPMSHGYDGRALLPDITEAERDYGHRGVGVAELAWAIRKHRPNRLSKELGLHTVEILCGLETSAAEGAVYHMTSTFKMEALQPGYYSTMWNGNARADAELSLVE